MTLATAEKPIRLVSSSEVATWQTCQMRWFINYYLHLVPKQLSDGLFKGIVGHEALSIYYNSLFIGNDLATAEDQVDEFFAEEMEKNNRLRKTGYISSKMASERIVLISKMNDVLTNYFKNYGLKDHIDYDIVEVEYKHVTEDGFAMRLDLLMRNRKTGALELWDHKFVTDFYSDWQLDFNSQLPKYMKVVINHREEDIAYGILNEIRTREVAEGWQVERPRIEYNEEIATLHHESHIIYSDEIRAHYDMDKFTCLEKVRRRRTKSDMVCKYCPFKRPCHANLRGEKMGEILKQEFEESGYGYN